MILRKYTSYKQLQRAREIFTKNRLYVNGWSFQYWMLASNLENVEAVYILFNHNRAYGCTILMKRDHGINCGVYIKSEHRRKGFGSLLFQEIKKDFPYRRFNTGVGIRGSESFFFKNYLTT